MQQLSARGFGLLPSPEPFPEDLTGISSREKMYWANRVRFLFAVILIWQAVHVGRGREKEEREEDVESFNVTAVKQQPNNVDAIINALNYMNLSYEDTKEQHSRVLVPFTGITESKKLNRQCCKNGGTCILGSFCACLKHFVGRYCEHDERKSNCGRITHGTWVLKGCRLCRCGYGTLNCLSEMIHGNCDRKSEKEEITRLRSNGKRLQQTKFALAGLLIVLLQFYCWQW